MLACRSLPEAFLKTGSNFPYQPRGALFLHDVSDNLIFAARLFESKKYTFLQMDVTKWS
jgi:hypothetical protein